MYNASDIERFNQTLRDKSPQEIIQWASTLDRQVFASTSFSPNSAGLLHMINEVAPEIPVIWVDSGYNMPDAYRTADKIMKMLDLDFRVYIPEMTAERRRPTPPECAQNGALLHAQPRMLLEKVLTLRVEDIGHLHGGPTHD